MPFTVGKLTPGDITRTSYILDDAYDRVAILPAMTAVNAMMGADGKRPDPLPPYFDEVLAYWTTGDDTGLPRLKGSRPDPTPIEYRALTASERARIGSVTRRVIPPTPGTTEKPRFIDLGIEANLLAFRIAGDLPDLPDPWQSADGPQAKRVRDDDTGLMALHPWIMNEIAAMFDMTFFQHLGRLILQKSSAGEEQFFRARGGDVAPDDGDPDAGGDDSGVRLRRVQSGEAEGAGVPGSPGVAGAREGAAVVDLASRGA